MAEPTDLIEQFRASGQRLWEEHGATAEAFCEWLRSLEARHPEQLVSPHPTRLTDEEIEEIVRMTGG